MMLYLFKQKKPTMVFHAAAYKHVPILETQQRSAIYNNVFGCKVLADAADHFAVDYFVFISTDKAVDPQNVMGRSKRLGEMICQSYNQSSHTKFITVRFGNVLDSVGSVVPLFREQIRKGGPVTVTHPEVSRYFMTIPEAAKLIIQAACLGKGGEVFVLDMGEPIKIAYLAEQMINLSGYQVDDIEIEYIGLRPGEKLHEQLFNQSEQLISTAYPKILQASPTVLPKTTLTGKLDLLLDACEGFDQEMMQGLVIELFNKGQQRNPASTIQEFVF